MFRALAALALLLVACRTATSTGVVEKDRTRYSIGTPPQGWAPEGFSENDLFFHAPDQRHSIAVNSTCEGFGDPSLDVLTQHLLMGFTDVEKLERHARPLDGRESLYSHYKARLDGVPLEMALVVLKKDSCVYDFTYLSPPGRYDDDRAVFAALLARFHAEPRQ
jgi:hypothetical protein